MTGIVYRKPKEYKKINKQYRRWRETKRESKIYRAMLFAICDGKCPICGVDMVLSFNSEVNQKKNSVTLDHIIPLRLKGSHYKEGLEIMCKGCNNKEYNNR